MSAACYNPDGSLHEGGNWTACDPTAQYSTCCSEGDVCLSNGLCLDAGANNLLSTQGCTESTWTHSPCHKYCPQTDIFAPNLFPCASGEDSAGGIKYCCGPDPTECCNNGSAFSVPVGTVVLRSGQSALPSSSSSLLSTGSSPSSSATGTTSAGPGPTSNSQSSGGGGNSNTLSIGLGVGLSLGIILIVVLVFLAVQLRWLRRYKHALNVQNPNSGGAKPDGMAMHWQQNGWGGGSGGEHIGELEVRPLEMEARPQAHEMGAIPPIQTVR
ncbi:uncharacterized protein K441DRAFT_668360 [Cenococcum geophilum 1.58]|uniref:uncharacterized protein n=1 Tax=Cenococcum geophilum 1.58 TaxID=794803 RepID=UPI00358FF7CD|nr:hypothetical protein K441DRAFT_668360 [Cenococcum geophilum 1.58]